MKFDYTTSLAWKCVVLYYRRFDYDINHIDSHTHQMCNKLPDNRNTLFTSFLSLVKAILFIEWHVFPLYRQLFRSISLDFIHTLRANPLETINHPIHIKAKFLYYSPWTSLELCFIESNSCIKTQAIHMISVRNRNESKEKLFSFQHNLFFMNEPNFAFPCTSPAYPSAEEHWFLFISFRFYPASASFISLSIRFLPICTKGRIRHLFRL